MAEKTGLGYTIGHIRMKYLNDADNAYAAGEYLVSSRILENFIGTIKEDTEVAKQLKEKLDEIIRLKDMAIREMEKSYQNDAGYFEKTDAKINRERIEVNAIHDIKTVCWIVSLENGLFYER